MISNPVAIVDYSYTTGVTQFQNAPVVLAATDMQVIYVGASGDELVMTNVTDYSVSQVGAEFTGSIVTLTATGIAKLDAVGGTVPVTCQRVMTATQEIDYIKLDNFPAENTEFALDKLTLLISQASEGVVPQDVRSLQFPPSDPDTLSPTLPQDTDRANKVLSFDANGEPTVTDLGSGTIGGMTGPASQVEGNLAIYDAVNGVLKQNSDISDSLFRQQTLDWLATTTWDSDLGHIATVTVATGVTSTPIFNVTNIKPGKYSLILIQDGTGGGEPQWGSMFEGTPSIKTGANDITTVEFVSDGTKLYSIGSSVEATADTTGSIATFAYLPSVWEDTGHLYCNGQAVSRTTYANLFDKLGTTYGVGDGSTTFNLPDYRGYFLRGLDSGGTNIASESGRALSPTAQADATDVNGLGGTGSGTASSAGAHTHPFDYEGGSSDIDLYRENVAGTGTPGSVADSVIGDENDGTPTGKLVIGSDGAHTHSVSTTLSITSSDSETRPANMAVHYGIKY